LRGKNTDQQAIFSYVSLEDRIPKRHPLRDIRKIVDKAMAEMSPTFDSMYAQAGRPSIPPEQLIRAMLIQVLFSIRSERQLMEELDFNLLYRWFVGLSMDDHVWNHSTFSKNRDRLLLHDVADRFFDAIRQQAAAKKLLSRDHFTIDGTLIEASASLKSFRPKDEAPHDDDPDDHGGRNEMVDFKGQKRSNETHESTTDPDSRLARKGDGKEAKLCYAGHILTENRHGLIMDAELTQATGTAETEAGLEMLGRLPGLDRKTAGVDKGYDNRRITRGKRDSARGAEEAVLFDRWSLDPPCRLRPEPAKTEAGRRALRLDEGYRWAEEAQAPWPGEGRLDLQVRGRSVQCRDDEAASGGSLTVLRGAIRPRMRVCSGRPGCGKVAVALADGRGGDTEPES
jgi:transposase